MKVNFLGKQLKSPTVLASGILGNSFDILERVHGAGCGIVTMKSIGPAPRDGHNNPTVIDLGHGLINAVGLPTPGYRDMDEEWKALEKRAFPLNASIYGGSVDEFVQVAEFVADKGPDFIELNISCPNSEKHGMLFGTNPESTFNVVSAVKRVTGQIPVIPKLTPQALSIGEIAKACEDAGADALCAINTAGPGMLIDIESRKPILAYKKGGLSGQMIRPIAVRCVYEICQQTTLPVIGLGGVTTGRDAVEMIMAGATLVGVGSAVNSRGIDVFSTITGELAQWLEDHGTTLEEIRGAAHE